MTRRGTSAPVRANARSAVVAAFALWTAAGPAQAEPEWEQFISLDDGGMSCILIYFDTDTDLGFMMSSDGGDATIVFRVPGPITHTFRETVIIGSERFDFSFRDAIHEGLSDRYHSVLIQADYVEFAGVMASMADTGGVTKLLDPDGKALVSWRWDKAALNRWQECVGLLKE